MSEWIRNWKRTNGRPNAINGKRIEVRHRDGSVSRCVADDFDESWNTSDNSPSDIIAYRIIEDKPAATEKDPAKIAPKLWAAYKDALNDEALEALRDVICVQWPNLRHARVVGKNGSAEDCSDINYAFLWKETTQGYEFWRDVNDGEYNRLTTALEMQDAEIGIAEPVNEVIYSTDTPPVVKHYASINPDGTIDVVLPVNSESPSLGYTCVFKEEDMVNHPPHYTQGGIECIDAIKAALTPEEFAGYCKGNALKYIWREKHKGGKESLQKAIWYLEKIAK